MIAKQLKAMLEDTKGQFFNVTFIKKDGTERTITAKYNKTEQEVNPSSTAHIPKYLTVKEYPQGRYRNINTETIKQIKIAKSVITVQ